MIEIIAQTTSILIWWKILASHAELIVSIIYKHKVISIVKSASSSFLFKDKTF